MSQQTAATNMYGYQSDEVKVNPFKFGLNTGARLTKFEWIPNGGKDGAEQEALEIIFTIAGVEKSYRRFPVTQAFGKNNEVITDPNTPEFKEAIMQLSSCVTHILHCFTTPEAAKAKFNRPINSFKEYAQVAASCLPANFAEIELDIFLEYQWKIKEGNDRTYLDIPTSMKGGKWLVPTVKVIGDWKETRKADPDDKAQNALFYFDNGNPDTSNNMHPFTRYGRYVKSPRANQQFNENAAQNEAAGANIAQAEPAPAATTTGAAPTAW